MDFPTAVKYFKRQYGRESIDMFDGKDMDVITRIEGSKLLRRAVYNTCKTPEAGSDQENSFSFDLLSLHPDYTYPQLTPDALDGVQEEPRALRNKINELRNGVNQIQHFASCFERLLEVDSRQMTPGDIHYLSVVGRYSCDYGGCAFQTYDLNALEQHKKHDVHFYFVAKMLPGLIAPAGFGVFDIGADSGGAGEKISKAVEMANPKLATSGMTTSEITSSGDDQIHEVVQPPQSPSAMHEVHAEDEESEGTEYTQSSRRSMGPKKQRPPTKEKAKWKCDFETCDKAFTRRATLHDHFRNHTNERPFKCNQCTKAFARLKDRKRHGLLHSREKTFYCPGCEAEFSREDGLDAHLASKKGMKCFDGMLNKMIAIMFKRDGHDRYSWMKSAPSYKHLIEEMGKVLDDRHRKQINIAPWASLNLFVCKLPYSFSINPLPGVDSCCGQGFSDSEHLLKHIFSKGGATCLKTLTGWVDWLREFENI